MGYDRYDTRDMPRPERSRWSGDRFSNSDRDWQGERRPHDGTRDERDERGFFERAGDEVASWFGDEEAERRRRQDQMMDEREHGWDRGPTRRRELLGGRDLERFRDRGRDYRPMTGDYGRSEQFVAAGGSGLAAEDRNRWTSKAGTSDWLGRSRQEEPQYDGWRQRHLDELDRDYDDYRRENQERFERDFGSWREQRMHKRGMLGHVREHMEVVGSDDEHVGTIDRVAGDRLILTKSDPESGGAHHSLMCSDIDRVEGDRVILDCSADEARHRWRDESRSRALFEREDQGEMGPRMLDRSFEGTYR